MIDINENIEFISLNKNDKKHILFCHSLSPNLKNRKTILFLNPLFDEKKRVHKFQADVARGLCKYYNIVRFDYFGTGDSYGIQGDFEIEEAVNDAIQICCYLKETKRCDEIYLLGLRFGADLGFRIAEKLQFVSKLIFIEPLINGKQYWAEQKIRRKSFYKINNITENTEKVEMNYKIYEDHLGFLVSETSLISIYNINLDSISVKNKTIDLIKLNCISSKKNMMSLFEYLKESNTVRLIQEKCPDFWSIQEPINTNNLKEIILNKCFNLK